MYFLLAPNILDEVAIVVHLVYTYLTRIQFDLKPIEIWAQKGMSTF